ncbi:MAG: hypothetical protein ACRD0P_10840 [Stackebrandtia sp.]
MTRTHRPYAAEQDFTVPDDVDQRLRSLGRGATFALAASAVGLPHSAGLTLSARLWSSGTFAGSGGRFYGLAAVIWLALAALSGFVLVRWHREQPPAKLIGRAIRNAIWLATIISVLQALGALFEFGQPEHNPWPQPLTVAVMFAGAALAIVAGRANHLLNTPDAKDWFTSRRDTIPDSNARIDSKP